MGSKGWSTPFKMLWQTVPTNFGDPVHLLVEDEEVEQIFGQDDKCFQCIGVYNNTLIQWDRYYVASSYTCIVITGPVRADVYDELPEDQ